MAEQERREASARTSEGAAARIEKLVAPSLEALGYEVVRVFLSGGQRGKLQIMIERLDGADLTIDHCAEASRAISALLDVEDPIAGAYTLEVSSPGIDRPLTRLKDFQRFAGFEARIELDRPRSGRRRFKGRLLGTEGDDVRLRLDEGEEFRVSFEEISKAKLVLTDELLAAARAERA